MNRFRFSIWKDVIPYEHGMFMKKYELKVREN